MSDHVRRDVSSGKAVSTGPAGGDKISKPLSRKQNAREIKRKLALIKKLGASLNGHRRRKKRRNIVINITTEAKD